MELAFPQIPVTSVEVIHSFRLFALSKLYGDGRGDCSVSNESILGKNWSSSAGLRVKLFVH